MSREIQTKIYDYNIDAIQQNGGSIEDTNFNYLLGTIDYSHEATFDGMVEFAESEDTNYYNRQKDLLVTLTDCNEKIILDELKERGIYLEEMENDFLGKLIAYALGYIQY